MRWNEDHESPDVIDRRGESSSSSTGGGPGLGGLLAFVPFLFRSPFGWLVLLVVGAIVAFGFFRRTLVPTAKNRPASEDKMAHFVAFVLDDTQANWTREFTARRRSYRRAKLVLFTDGTDTACGYGRSATGPFYCPADERAYIDLGFYRDLEQRLGARGDFAKAYVIAHEIGHHVQKILGANAKVPRSGAEGPSGASVRLELQADCYAGVWAHSTAQRSILEKGDIESALGAAAAIGDDRLQRRGGGRVRPETFTHGTSEQRVSWFQRGASSGRLEDCDTFTAGSL
jgi:predicted metalloprotease